VRVPDKAGDGNATVTISFPAWQAFNVASSMVEIPIVEPKPKRDKKAKGE
jgi:hypothetical protein